LEVARVRVQPVAQKKDETGRVLQEEAVGYPALCSGFAIKGRHTPPHFVTAGHCLPSALQEESAAMGQTADKIYFVVDDGFVAKREVEESIQEGYVTEIDSARLKGASGTDIGFTKLKRKELETTKVLELAIRPPRYSEKLYAIGYPGGFGPVKFECRYVGVGLRTEGGDFSQMIAIDELDCPSISTEPDDIGGMSGGAIVNSSNEVVGVVVQQIQGSQGLVMAGSSQNMNRIGMVRLSEENVRVDGGLYQSRIRSGKYKSKYLDWTTGEEVWVNYQLREGQLQGVSTIESKEGTVLETWEFKNGNWM
jgi:hypothetical protein